MLHPSASLTSLRRPLVAVGCLIASAAVVFACSSDPADDDDDDDDDGEGGSRASSSSPSSTSSGNQVCVPGSQVVCACLDGTSGAQVCAADGLSLGPCQNVQGTCSMASTTSTSTSTTTTSSTSSTTSSTTTAGSTSASSSGQTSGSTSGQTSSTTSGMTAGSTSSGILMSCEDLTGQCGPAQGDPGDDPTNSCFECAVLGNGSVATDGGECADEYSECFGLGDAACTGAGEPECCDLYNCIPTCDFNQDGFIDPGPELDCYCTNDGLDCVANQLPGSCFGDYPNGLFTAYEWELCFFGDGVTTGVCGNVCI